MAVGHSVSASDLYLSLFHLLCCVCFFYYTDFATVVGVSALQLLQEKFPKRVGGSGQHLNLPNLMGSATEY